MHASPYTREHSQTRARTHALHAIARDADSDGTRWNQPDANLRGRAAGDRATSAARAVPLTARLGRRGLSRRTDSKMVARHYCQVGGLPPLRQADRRRLTAARRTDSIRKHRRAEIFVRCPSQRDTYRRCRRLRTCTHTRTRTHTRARASTAAVRATSAYLIVLLGISAF